MFGDDEFHAHFLGTLSELAEHAFAVALFVIFLTLIGVFLALGQHRIDQASELVSGGGHRFGTAGGGDAVARR